MAFSQGQVSTEGASFKRFIGVASVNVLGVNPTKKELEGFYGNTFDKDPEYVGKVEVNGKEVPQVRLDFIVKADSDKYLDNENNPVNLISKVSIFLRKAYRFNKDNTKVQVIDKYGRTAWVTVEQAKAKEIPVYSNGPANIDSNYRPAYVGEEDLIKLLITYLNIPSCQNYIEGKWIMKSAAELADCEASLEHIEDYFKGDFSELKTIIGYQPNNKMKVLFGIKTNDDGKQYQVIYSRKFMNNRTSDYTSLEKEVKELQNAGSMANTEFKFAELQEYVVSNTNFESSEAADLPFGETSTTAPW